MAKNKKQSTMTDTELRSTLSQKINNATNYSADVFTRHRIEAERFYLGEPLGNEIDGRSTFVSRVVAETIDTVMPQIMRAFYTSSPTVRFMPRKLEDIQQMEQATDYVNYVWNKNNPGFEITHDWFKAALMFRIGIIKIYWDTSIDVTEESYEGLNESEMQAVGEDPELEIVSESAYTDPHAITVMENMIKQQVAFALVNNQQPPEAPEIDEDQLPKLYDITVKRSKERGRIKVVNVPSEEYLFDHWTTDQDSKTFMCHRRQMTKSELREMGFDEDLIESIAWTPAEEIPVQEKYERFQPEQAWWGARGVPSDDSTDSCYVSECYLAVDYDQDGIAEYRRIIVAGQNSGYVILDNEIVDNHPFVVATPIRMPFKMVGQSITDQTLDFQKLHTILWRQAIDNTALTTQQRYVITENVNMDDLMSVVPGAPIRTQGDNPSAEIVPLPVNPIGQMILGLTDAIDDRIARRTGVTPYTQGLDADELNPTATGAQLQLQAGALRTDLIARNFAESMRRAFERIYAIISQHQDEPTPFLVGTQWIAIRPTSWSEEYDCDVCVGLGTNDRDKDLARISGVIQMQTQIVQQQAANGNPLGPFVTPENIYNALERFISASGLKNVDQYFTDPKTVPPAPPKQNQPPQPDPTALAQIQANTQIEQAKLAEKKREFDAKEQFAQQKATAELQLKAKQFQANTLNSAISAQQTHVDHQNDAMLRANQFRLDTSKAISDAQATTLQGATAALSKLHEATVNAALAKHHIETTKKE